MNPSGHASRASEGIKARDGRLRSVMMILIFDVAAPLSAYYLLRAAGLAAWTALLLSGIFPAIGVTIGGIRNRRLDIVGALVLAGLVLASVLGVISHNARLLLLEGSVPTGVFAVACLSSLFARRPLMYGLALEFVGPDTARGREMTRLWQYDGYRHVMRVITAVWGVGFLIEAGARVVIVYNTSTGTALAITTVTPFVYLGILSAWTIGYGTYHRKKGERLMPGISQGPGPSHANTGAPGATDRA